MKEDHCSKRHNFCSCEKLEGLKKIQACMGFEPLTFARGFIKRRAPGKLTGCEHDFARLLYISKNFFLIQGTIKNSFKLQSCPFLDESYRV